MSTLEKPRPSGRGGCQHPKTKNEARPVEPFRLTADEIDSLRQERHRMAAVAEEHYRKKEAAARRAKAEEQPR